MNSDDCPDPQQLEQFLLGKLNARAIAAISEHVLHCRHCAQRAASSEPQDELTGALAAEPIPNTDSKAIGIVIASSEPLANHPDSGETTIRSIEPRSQSDHSQLGNLANRLSTDFLTTTDSHQERFAENGTEFPEVPGFEILGKLGSGGMGVVYRARQTALNRIVALKMLRAHALFDRELIVRFQTEAESIARLTHPHIISIYEVGLAHRLPFVALEYVPGENLAELLRRVNVSARVAAEIVAKLADAIACAHHEGVIHRDLKPENILVGHYGGSEDAPEADQDRTTSESLTRFDFPLKITDFGLARLTYLDDRQTRSGTVIGTPAYMAPEQAVGDRAAAGQSVDIYSLGAILYEMLTGRAPFRAESTVETLRQVIDADPVAPRMLSRDVPADLETICLKCLRKHPSGRYQTAGDLADDLNRFLLGKSVLARPLPGYVRLAGWCWRRPAVALLIGIVMALLVMVAVGSSLFAVRVARLNRTAMQAKLDSDNDRSVAVTAITKLSDALVEDFERRGGTVKHRQHLVDVALNGLQNVTRSDARVAGSGIVRAHLSRASLNSLTGDLESSRQSLDHARTLANELVKEFPNSEVHQFSLALVHEALADFLISTGSAESAIPEIDRTTEILDRLIAQSPTQPSYLQALLRIRQLMVMVHETLDDLEALYDECQSYLPVAERLCEMTDRRMGREELATLHRRMQDSANTLSRFEDAEQHGDAAVALFAELKNEAPPDDIMAAMNYWVVLQSQAAYYVECGRYREAAGHTDAAIAGYRNLLLKDPENLATKFRLAEGLRCKAGISYYSYDYDQVRAASHESMDLFGELIEASPANHRYKAFLLCATEGAVDSAMHAGDWQGLDRIVGEAVTLYRSLDPRHVDAMFDGYYGRIYESIWEATQRHLGKYDGELSADGNCALLTIYSYLAALQGRYEFSTIIQADITRTCGLELSNQDELFLSVFQMTDRSRYWRGMSLIHEAVAFGLLAERETSALQQSRFIKRAVAAIKRVEHDFPVVTRDRLYSKAGELGWLMETQWYKNRND